MEAKFPERGNKITRLYCALGGLDGRIPPSVWRLAYIRQLVLSENWLSGAIPDSLSALTDLAHLHLQSNRLRGNLPKGMESWGNLQLFVIHCNVLETVMPDSIGFLRSLRKVSLGVQHATVTWQNWLYLDEHTQKGTLWYGSERQSGELPAMMCRLSYLDTLLLCDANLRGSVPDCMGTLQDLAEVYLCENQLRGALPSLLEVPKLHIAHWEFNEFSGNLPEERLVLLGNSFYFRLGYPYTCLDVTGSILKGTIPDSIAVLSNIHDRFCLGKNLLTGSVPASIGALQRLEYLHLSKNYLEGSLPARCAWLDGLVSFDLHMQKNGLGLEGSIPDVLSGLLSLSTLTLGGGDSPALEGSMPLGLSRVTGFQTLMVSNTHLSGKIPELTSTLSSLFLYGGNLRGGLPSKARWERELFTDISRKTYAEAEWRPTFVVANNDLVCHLPRYEDLRPGHCVALFGNDFVLKSRFPDWVHPHERGKFFGHPEHEFREHVLRVAIITLLLFAAFYRRAELIVGHNNVALRLQRLQHHLPILYGACSLTARRMMQLALLACPVIALNLKGIQYECGAILSKLSAVKHPSQTSLLIVAFLSILISTGVLRINQSIARVTGNSPLHVVCRRDTAALGWTTWILIVLSTSLPGTAYCITSVIPGVFQESAVLQSMLFHTASLVNAAVTKFLLQYVGQFMAKKGNLSLHALLCTGRVATSWLLPALVIILLHPRCFSYWSLWWKGCRRNTTDALDIVAKIGYERHDVDTGRHLKALVCGNKFNRAGGRPLHLASSALSPTCARAVGDKLIRLVLGKAVWLYLVANLISCMRWIVGLQGTSEARSLGSTIASLLEMSILFVPFFPLLAALLYTGSLLNFVSLIMITRPEASQDQPRWPSWPLHFVLGIAWTYHFCLVRDTGAMGVTAMLLQLARLVLLACNFYGEGIWHIRLPADTSSAVIDA